MKKKYLVLTVVLLLFLSACTNFTSSKEEGSSKDVENISFSDDYGSYNIKKISRVKKDNKEYVILLMDYENISNTNQVPWENSIFKIEQENGSSIFELNRIFEYDNSFKNKEKFEDASKEVSPKEKLEIELVFETKYEDDDVFLRGILDNNKSIEFKL